MDEIELFKRLGLALAIGLLIGVERGWQGRNDARGSRIAGIRTIALMGLLGGLAGVFSLDNNLLALAIIFAAFTAFVVASHASRLEAAPERRGVTTEIAELVTFCLGALAAHGHMAAAAAGGVVVMTLLSFKETLHLMLLNIAANEIQAVAKLLLISVVILPVLPNQGYGPGDAINPYKLWWIVVLISSISFVGYVAIKTTGARIGTMLTGFFGGLASSTALTMTFSRVGKDTPELRSLLAAGIAVASGTMFLRILLLVAALNPLMLHNLAPALGVMAILSYLGAGFLWLDRRAVGLGTPTTLTNPFELMTAIKFALFLGAILVASKFLQQSYGHHGIYLLSAVSGLADVDAITVSMAHMADDQAEIPAAATSIVIAAVVNTLVKVGIVTAVCPSGMAWRTAAVFSVALAGGGLALTLT